MDLKKKIETGHLILDGAMGTYFSAKHPDFPYPCELANLEYPQAVQETHRKYIEAGADVIKTNTFTASPSNKDFSGDKFEEVIRAGCRLAGKAAEESGRDVAVLGDIGPLVGVSEDFTEMIYRNIVDVFIDEGITNFLFETNSNSFGILKTAAYIRTRVKDAFIMVSFAVQTDGYTREGVYYQDLLREMGRSGLVDVTGLNCILSALQIRTKGSVNTVSGSS